MGEIANPALAGLRERMQPVPTREPSRDFAGTLRDLSARVPGAGRRPFVSRRPDTGANAWTPGRFQLLPHARVIHALERALLDNGIHAEETPAQCALSRHATQLSLSLNLPGRYDLDPGDALPLGLQLHCETAIDGSLRLLACWRRDASQSAFAVGVTRLEFQLAHRLPARIADIAPQVSRAIALADAEGAQLRAWREQLVTRDRLVAWTDGAVRRMWGPRAAARVFHIAMTGWDAEPAYGFERATPSRRTMQATDPVPAAAPFVETVYDALLAAAWIARGSRDASERLDRAVEVAVLMRSLLRSGVAP
ncbi:MAG: hypothetical protein WDZ63_08485 [Burkholderiales bacterium]